jgi:hypothetical protein
MNDIWHPTPKENPCPGGDIPTALLLQHAACTIGAFRDLGGITPPRGLGWIRTNDPRPPADNERVRILRFLVATGGMREGFGAFLPPNKLSD